MFERMKRVHLGLCKEASPFIVWLLWMVPVIVVVCLVFDLISYWTIP